MSGRVKILTVLLIVCLVSCVEIPSVKLDGYKPAEKLPIKVALIVDEQFKNTVHEISLSARCGYFKRNPNGLRTDIITHVDKGVMNTQIKTGVATEDLFIKRIPYLFEKTDIYEGISEVKNENDYDYILVPEITIYTSYDKEKAFKRKIEIETAPFPFKGLKRVAGTSLWIKASVVYQLHVKDAKSGAEVTSFSGKGSATSSTTGAECDDERGYDTWVTSDYSRTIGEAMNDAFKNLLKTTEKGLIPIAKSKLEEKALPSDLALNVRFSDSSGFLPNNSLDAGEDAEMVVTIKNTGKGSGYGTNLEVTSDNSKIIFAKEIKVGDIQPNETKEIKVNLKAGLDIGDGKASFQFNLKEKRGYDAKKVVAYVPTARLEKPQLEIISTEINDSETGLAKGNGNGIPESGETIELTAFIKNQGAGKAIGVNLNGVDITSGIEWVRDSILVGTIQQGEIAKAKIAFTIPRNFDAREIATNLRVSDIRGVNNAEKKVALSYAKRSPDVQYSYRIYSKGNPVSTITNGEEYEIEITINNKGQIPARDVVIMVKGGVGGLYLSRSKMDIGEIKERASISGQRFTLSVPRTFVETQAALNIKIAQSDFSSVENSIQIPMDVKSPKLKYIANLQSKSGGNVLEQGENAILEIQVLNEGNLSADGVKIKLESKDENLRILGQTEALIGKIPANSKSETVKFQLSTFRRIKVGETYLAVNIAQNDFLPVDSQYALNIREEGITVVDVAAEDRGKSQAVTKTQSGPAINLKTPQNVETTGDESFRLAFDVTDSRNVESIKVTVNGNVILDEKPASKKKDVFKNIPLKEGDNKIVIIAYNADNIPSRKELVVTRIAEDDVDSPPVTSLNNPNAVAVVIGISKYENRDIPLVDYAKRDALTVKEYLIKTLGFKETNIKEFYDEQATSKKLESYFKTHLKNRVRPDISDVFIFYSGHGVPESNEAYFVPYDLDPYDIKTTGYAVKEFYKQMEDIKAKSVTIVIDACFSGKSEGDTPVIKSASPVFFDISNPLLTIKNGTVFTSSSGKQISSWYHNKQHGLFTYYFLQGLKGRADMDNDGTITVRELEKYLSKNVPEQARVLYNREQTPEVVGDKDTVLVRLK